MLSAPESSSRAFRKGYNNISEGDKELLKLTRDPHRLKTLLCHLRSMKSYRLQSRVQEQ